MVVVEGSKSPKKVLRSRRPAPPAAPRSADPRRLTQPLTRPIFPDSSGFFGLSWETSPQTDSTPEASERPGSGRIEFSSKSTAFLMQQFLWRSNESRVMYPVVTINWVALQHAGLAYLCAAPPAALQSCPPCQHPCLQPCWQPQPCLQQLLAALQATSSPKHSRNCHVEAAAGRALCSALTRFTQ